jgi:aldose 1-epimerase
MNLSRGTRSFGQLADGRAVEAITLGEADGVQVEVLTYGAIIRRLTVPVRGRRRDVVLHFDDLARYERDRAYVGPVVGRFGNRIARGRFMLDGLEHQVTVNEGENHLHGGAVGFSKQLWRVLESGDRSRVTLGLHSPAGDEGFPGNLDATLEIAVSADAMQVRLRAHCDAPCPVNLTYHPYFNLAADPRTTATDHWLRIPASHYLPVADGLIPTGEMAAVSGTPFDFQRSRRLAPPPPDSDPQLALAGGYDHCWLLDEAADCSCELVSPDRDLAMTISGSGPGLQFYNGQFLSRAHADLGSGVILEPQGLPNAMNEPRFPNVILRPGEGYRADIDYRFHSPGVDASR